MRLLRACSAGRLLKYPNDRSGYPLATTISPLIQTLNVPKEKGHIRTTPEMRIEGQANAWGLCDSAMIINSFDNKASPTTTQFAQRQGRQAALNLVRILRGQPTQPGRPRCLAKNMLLSRPLCVTAKYKIDASAPPPRQQCAAAGLWPIFFNAP